MRQSVMSDECVTGRALPSSLVQRSPAGWWWRTGNYSSGSSEGRPPPRQCHSTLFSSDQQGPRCSEENTTDNKRGQTTQRKENLNYLVITEGQTRSST